jgi:hypothetical protein
MERVSRLLCEHCGNSFDRRPAERPAEFRRRKFCSRRCSTEARRGKPAATRGRTLVAAEDRFWAKVDRTCDNDCWEWTGAREVAGYGFFFRSSKPRRWYKAHRFSYELHVGPIPEGLYVCHHCDNPPCVNPAHLFLGDARANNDDRDQKGRGKLARGAGGQHPRARLSQQEVDEIRSRHAAGETQVALARAFGLSQGHISRLVNRSQWRD